MALLFFNRIEFGRWTKQIYSEESKYDGFADVFLSFSRAEKEKAHELASQIEGMGFTVIAYKPEEPWNSVIGGMINGISKSTVVLYTERMPSMRDDYMVDIDDEIDIANGVDQIRIPSSYFVQIELGLANCFGKKIYGIPSINYLQNILPVIQAEILFENTIRYRGLKKSLTKGVKYLFSKGWNMKKIKEFDSKAKFEFDHDLEAQHNILMEILKYPDFVSSEVGDEEKMQFLINEMTKHGIRKK